MVDLKNREPTFRHFFFNKETKRISAMIWLCIRSYQR